MRTEILKLIEENRISTVEVSDALGKKGVVDSVYPLNSSKFVCGEIYYVCAYSESNYSLHKQIENIPEGKVVYIDTFGCKNRAAIGDLISKYLILYRRSKGIILNGLARDIHRLKKEEYPIWLQGVTPLGCFNKEVALTAEIEEHMEKESTRLSGSIAICDDSGVTIIEKEHFTEKFLEDLKRIELQEDIWYFSIDTLKKSTYETICKKFYLKDDGLIPENLKRSIKDV